MHIEPSGAGTIVADRDEMLRPIWVLGVVFLFAACGKAAHPLADAGAPGPQMNGEDAGAASGDDASSKDGGGWTGAGDASTGIPSDGGAVHDDGAVHDGGSLDGGPIAGDGGAVCTSNTFWIPQDHHGAEMRPGEPCIECHITMSTLLQIGGTVYPTLHEPNDCFGEPGGMQVILTDPMGRQVTLAVNAVGNFYLPQASAIATPFTAKVIRGTAERPMLMPITDGNCNHCHTETGFMSAPGRILVP